MRVRYVKLKRMKPEAHSPIIHRLMMVRFLLGCIGPGAHTPEHCPCKGCHMRARPVHIAKVVGRQSVPATQQQRSRLVHILQSLFPCGRWADLFNLIGQHEATETYNDLHMQRSCTTESLLPTFISSSDTREEGNACLS